MNLLKKCLIEFNNEFTNKITEKEVDDDEQFRFTLLDMQKFAKKYAEEILAIELPKKKRKLKKNIRVLGRDSESSKWVIDVFNHKKGSRSYCILYSYLYCIPYKGNKHLLGTRDNE